LPANIINSTLVINSLAIFRNIALAILYSSTFKNNLSYIELLLIVKTTM